MERNKTKIYLPKTDYQSNLKGRGRLCHYAIHLSYAPVVAVNCDNQKAMEKEKWHKEKFEKSTKNDSIKFRKIKAKIEIKL